MGCTVSELRAHAVDQVAHWAQHYGAMGIQIWIFVLFVFFGYGANLGYGFWGGVGGLLVGLLVWAVVAGVAWILRRMRRPRD